MSAARTACGINSSFKCGQFGLLRLQKRRGLLAEPVHVVSDPGFQLQRATCQVLSLGAARQDPDRKVRRRGVLRGQEFRLHGRRARSWPDEMQRKPCWSGLRIGQGLNSAVDGHLDIQLVPAFDGHASEAKRLRIGFDALVEQLPQPTLVNGLLGDIFLKALLLGPIKPVSSFRLLADEVLFEKLAASLANILQVGFPCSAQTRVQERSDVLRTHAHAALTLRIQVLQQKNDLRRRGDPDRAAGSQTVDCSRDPLVGAAVGAADDVADDVVDLVERDERADVGLGEIGAVLGDEERTAPSSATRGSARPSGRSVFSPRRASRIA